MRPALLWLRMSYCFVYSELEPQFGVHLQFTSKIKTYQELICFPGFIALHPVSSPGLHFRFASFQT
jgi:hypothetical protein